MDFWKITDPTINQKVKYCRFHKSEVKSENYGNIEQIRQHLEMETVNTSIHLNYKWDQMDF